MQVIEVRGHTIYSLAFAADGQTMMVGTRGGEALAVSPFGKERVLFDTQLSRPGKMPSINVVRAHPSKNLVAIAAEPCWLLLDRTERYDFDYVLPTTEPVRMSATSLEFLDDATLAVGLGDRVRESAGGFELWSIEELGSNVEECANGFKLWSFDGEPKRREPRFSEPKGVRAIAVHRASGLVAWSTGHQKVTVWNPRGQDPAHIPLKHTSPAIAFHPDGARLAVAQEWGAKIIDIAKRHEVATLTGHKGRVTCLAYRPDGRVLATGSWDGTVRLWDVATGAAINSLSSSTGRIFTLAYAPDGLTLAAAGDAGNVVLWDVD